MTTSLVSFIMQFVTPDVVARIAAALGLDRSTARKAIGGGVPALLTGLAGVAATPAGARQLSNALTEQQPGMVDRLANALGDAGLNAVVVSGTSVLSRLLGRGTFNALSGALGSYAGLSDGISKSLLGILGPIVMGGLSQQQRARGLDTSELVTFLALQKDQIAASIPTGLAHELRSAGLLDAVDPDLESRAAPAIAAASRNGRASERTVASARQAADATDGSASSQWPIWLAALALLIGGLWFFLGSPTADRLAATRAPAETTGRAEPAALADLTAGGLNLADQITSSVDQMKMVLMGMTDAASAQAAVPKLRQAADQLDTVNSLAARLPPEGKRAIAGMVETAMPTIEQLCDKALATPGVRDIAKPAIEELRVKLDSLARA